MIAGFSRSSRRRYVLDANALTGFFEDRRIVAEKVRHLMGEALRHDEPLLMSAVNWGEVFYIAWRRHGEDIALDVEAKLRDLPVAVIPVDRERASRSGALKEKHRLGYADAFAAELAMERGAWLVTADSEFSKVGKGLSVYPLPRHEK
ncbi:MAG TPA: type II toxin-antitoxin system VapC family toxin [Terriglobales bacterium]|jgi:predicted nucleic acid-binding protein|nr:type II toxin-antitoxin system VapC family toxin [Terriglobales bacterium]